MERFKRRLIISLSIFAGAVLIFIILIILLNADLNKSTQQILELKGQINLRNQTIEVATNSVTEMDIVRASTAVLEKILPNIDELINLPGDLERLADELNLEFSFQFGAEKEEQGGPSTIDFSLNLTGQYKNIQLYLQELEKHRYIILLDKMDLREHKESGHTLNIKGLIFIASKPNPTQ